jgi:DNA polymerase-3 subunit gamma/tau
VWDEVLTTVKRKSARVHAFVRDASVSDVQGDELVLSFRDSFHANSASQQPALILEALHDVLGGTWRLRVQVGDGGAAPASASRTQAAARATTAPNPSAGRSAGGADDDWPETARPGGAGAPAQGAPARTATQPARPAAKAAPARGARPAGTRGGRDSAPPPDEPPFDPDYDRSPGFDPGDEPLDDGRPAVRESSEQQAMRAVKDVFAVEHIDSGPGA